MKKRTQNIIVAAALLAVIALFAFFLKDVMIPYIRMELNNDIDGARELLTSRGIFGFLTVILVEALQMVVIFIPAEFIQISSGLSYPFWLALLLCDLGVCLGATIIYVLVRVFRFDNERFDKKEAMIEHIAARAKKDRGTVLLLYFLFIMPFIPFGAICYFGSHKKLRYGRYILTVATGVIPSIVTSNLMGAATRYFLGNDLSLPLLVLIIAALAIPLFVVLFLFLDKIYFKENDGTPDSIIYAAFFRFAHAVLKRKQRLTIDDTGLNDRKAPFVVLSNHESFYDFYYIKQLLGDRNPAYVVNRHYLSFPVIKPLSKKAGFIPKRLFSPDPATPLGVMRAIRAGFPVVIFPEGRLSVSGRSYPILDRGAAFYRRLGVDLVLCRISGAYLCNPKWRKRFYRGDISVSVKRIVTKEEAAAMTDAALDALISETLAYDDSASETAFAQKDKAKGLENILYRCADCGALYATESTGNALTCNACGKTHTLDEHYRFEDGLTIGAYYAKITDMERETLLSEPLETPVKVMIFPEKGRKRREQGVCTLDAAGLSYRSERTSFAVPFAELPALPFSCGTEFETYHNGDLYYFYPTENPRQVARWALLVDLIKEAHNEKG